MIERLVLEGERARALTMLGSRVEHEQGINFRVGVEHREHRSLRLVRKVEVAVPGEDAVKASVERQMAHVGDDPFPPRHPITRQGELAHGSRVLDLGCGGGEPVASLLVEHGMHVTGVDR